MTSASD